MRLACVAEDAGVVGVQARVLEVATELPATPGAVSAGQVPSLVTALCALVLDGLAAQCTLVRIVGRQSRQTRGQLQGGGGVVVSLEAV